jgi:glycosyltransferase involved in cell wall biosynthesis
MPKTPRISVVIPTHNRAQYLRTSIDSVLAQSFTDFELIVVDDSSSFDLWVRMAERHKLANLPEVLVCCRAHDGNTPPRCS